MTSQALCNSWQRFVIIFVCGVFFFLFSPLFAQAGSQVYTTPGTYTFTVPDNVTTVYVSIAGGGGGGAALLCSFVGSPAYPGGTSSFGSLVAKGGGADCTAGSAGAAGGPGGQPGSPGVWGGAGGNGGNSLFGTGGYGIYNHCSLGYVCYMDDGGKGMGYGSGGGAQWAYQGGGGGAEAYADVSVSVTPGSQVTVVVGAGGKGAV